MGKKIEFDISRWKHAVVKASISNYGLGIIDDINALSIFSISVQPPLVKLVGVWGRFKPEIVCMEEGCIRNPMGVCVRCWDYEPALMLRGCIKEWRQFDWFIDLEPAFRRK